MFVENRKMLDKRKELTSREVFNESDGEWIALSLADYFEQKYKRLLTGKTIKGDKHTIYELMFIMNGELNINTLSFQKSGRDTYYIKVDDSTKQYYVNKFI